MKKVDLQQEYDLIYSFFKTTTEPFDKLEWDGKSLNVCNNQKIVERYSFRDLKELIKELRSRYEIIEK